MGEPWAREAIRLGYIDIDGKRFKIKPVETGSCDACYFENKCNCQKARTICCTGGNILQLDRTKNTNKR